MSYIKSKSFKIVSRFYVIYGDYEPIYVGYTNRTVKQRFKEHQKDKDFSDYDSIEVRDLVNEKLSFNFTWDYEQTCKNADKVSLREGQLVQQYGTQDSVFQKAIGGGQTWSTEKWFVKSNKDNPKFTRMSGAEIKTLIDTERAISVDIGSFVITMEPKYKVDIHSFVNHINSQYKVDIGSFVSNMKPQYKVDIGDFVSTMKPQYKVDIGDFVSTMKPQYKVDIHNFVNCMKPQYQVNIRDFVNHMKPQYQVDIRNFINNMKRREQ